MIISPFPFKADTSGFTFVELIVVLTILSLIAFMAAMRYGQSGSVAGVHGESARIADTMLFARNAALQYSRSTSVAFLPAGTTTNFSGYELRLWSDDLTTYNIMMEPNLIFNGVFCSVNSVASPSERVDEVRFDRAGVIDLLFNHAPLVNAHRDALVGLTDTAFSTKNSMTIQAYSGMLRR